MRKGGGHAPWQPEELMKDFVSHARDWAIEKHGNQKYGQGEGPPPYRLNPSRVSLADTSNPDDRPKSVIGRGA